MREPPGCIPALQGLPDGPWSCTRCPQWTPKSVASEAGSPRAQDQGMLALQEKPASRGRAPAERRSALSERLCLQGGAQAGGHGSSGSWEGTERAPGGSGLRQECPSLSWPLLLIAVMEVR